MKTNGLKIMLLDSVFTFIFPTELDTKGYLIILVPGRLSVGTVPKRF